MRFVKPIDIEMINVLAQTHDYLVTLEENAIQGGAGSAVAEVLNSSGKSTALLQLGLPDYFIPQATRQEALADLGLDTKGIEEKFSTLLQNKVIYKINAMIISSRFLNPQFLNGETDFVFFFSSRFFRLIYCFIKTCWLFSIWLNVKFIINFLRFKHHAIAILTSINHKGCAHWNIQFTERHL